MNAKIISFIIIALLSASSVCCASDLCYEYVKGKKYDDAIKECSRQINGETRVDDVGIAYVNRGLAYVGKGQYDLAVDDYTTAIKAKPNYENAYYNRGNAYYALERYGLAIDDYNKVIELNPKNPNSYYNIACIRSVEACKWLKKSVENGFKDWGSVKTDKDLDNIRSSSCYREIMKGK